ncbi:hypothetical protein V8Z71_24705, partial [Vibrio echinoideorum]
ALLLIYQFESHDCAISLNQIQDIYISTFGFTFPKGFSLSEIITTKREPTLKDKCSISHTRNDHEKY